MFPLAIKLFMINISGYLIACSFDYEAVNINTQADKTSKYTVPNWLSSCNSKYTHSKAYDTA